MKGLFVGGEGARLAKGHVLSATTAEWDARRNVDLGIPDAVLRNVAHSRFEWALAVHALLRWWQ